MSPMGMFDLDAVSKRVPIDKPLLGCRAIGQKSRQNLLKTDIQEARGHEKQIDRENSS